MGYGGMLGSADSKKAADETRVLTEAVNKIKLTV
jgi:hypothetical protein